MITTVSQYFDAFIQCFNLDKNWLLEDTKSDGRSKYRQYYSYFGHVHFKFGKRELAKPFGYDHTSIIAHIKAVKDFLFIRDAVTVVAIDKLKSFFLKDEIANSFAILENNYERLEKRHVLIKSTNKRYLNTIRDRDKEIERLLNRIKALESQLEPLKMHAA